MRGLCSNIKLLYSRYPTHRIVVIDPLPAPANAPSLASLGEKVRTFVKNEDQNFSLFNYVNEQQNDVEKLEEQLQQLEQEEKRFAQVTALLVICHTLY